MMPRYSESGQVCEIGLERLHYTSDKIYLDSDLSSNAIDEIFNELVPASERGPRLKDQDLIDVAGVSVTTTVEYENISTQIVGENWSAGSKRGMNVENVAAVIRWKNRNCQ